MGLTDIVQRLGAPSQVASTCSSSNEAVFGLGPLGTWHVVIQGHWRPKQPLDGVTARVAFDCFSIRLLGFMGATLPSWLPALQVPLPAAGDGADWATTYLDSDLRLGKGRSGNLFLFKRRRRRRSELL